MLPYSVVFGIAWTILFIAWTQLGLPLGPGGG
jgi:aminobenzoyl-glutamate transport protein